MRAFRAFMAAAMISERVRRWSTKVVLGVEFESDVQSMEAAKSKGRISAGPQMIDT